MLKKDLMHLAKHAAKATVHKLPEPKPPSKQEMKAMAMPNAYDDRPRIYLDDKEAPFLKDWKGGQDHTLVVRVHVAEHTKHSVNDEKPRFSASLVITEMLAVPDSK